MVSTIRLHFDFGDTMLQEDKRAGESHKHSLLTSSPSSERYQCDGVSQHDAPGAVAEQAPGGCPRQQMTAALHQGLPHPAQGSPSIPATAAGAYLRSYFSHSTTLVLPAFIMLHA